MEKGKGKTTRRKEKETTKEKEITEKAERKRIPQRKKGKCWTGTRTRKGNGTKGNYQGRMPMDIGTIEGDEHLIQWEPDQEDFHGAYESWQGEDYSADQEWPDDYEDNYDYVFALEDDSWWASDDYWSPEEDSWWNIEVESWPQEAEAQSAPSIAQQTTATNSSGPAQSVSTIASTLNLVNPSSNQLRTEP